MIFYMQETQNLKELYRDWKITSKWENRPKKLSNSVDLVNTQKISEIWIGVELSKHNGMFTIGLRAPPGGKKLMATEEEMARSRIGTLQWYASLTRPDMCYDLADILSEINKEKHKCSRR